MIKGISAVWLPVTDMPRAVAFYRDDLGLEVLEHDADWSEVTAGDQRIGLNARESPAGDGGAVIAFAVDDLEAAVDQLKDRASRSPVSCPSIRGAGSRRSRTRTGTTCRSIRRPRVTDDGQLLNDGSVAAGARRGLRLPGGLPIGRGLEPVDQRVGTCQWRRPDQGRRDLPRDDADDAQGCRARVHHDRPGPAAQDRLPRGEPLDGVRRHDYIRDADGGGAEVTYSAEIELKGARSSSTRCSGSA